MNREPISVALFNALKGAYPWVTSSRNAQIWGNVPDQPAMFLIAWTENDSQEDMFLTKYQLKYMCLVYLQASTQTGPDSVATETQVNQILAAVESALGTPNGSPNTLGVSNVINCWIEGDIYKDLGILDQQAAIVIPITVLAGI